MSKPDDFDEIEALLAGLPMREPSQMLDARVASTLKESTRAKLPWLAIAAALLLTGAVTLAIVFTPVPTVPPPIAGGPSSQPNDAPGSAPSILRVSSPTESLNMTWTRDVAEETRYTTTGQPYRAVVREAVDHKAWIDTETGETGQLRVPREELIVVKQTTF